jgi:bifunctional DNA-binding transcriptional regulator/antitoxin component of YhaV-PrlF toxin-antitoxin module
MGAVTVKVDANGALVVPKETLEALGIPNGGELRLMVVDGALRGSTGPSRLAAVRRLQRRLADAKPAGDDSSVVDELIADRRAEAAREEAAEQAWEEGRRRGQAAE